MHKDQIVLITGGGTGLGLACAQEFSRNGATVCITGRRVGVLEKAKESIDRAATKGGFPTVRAITSGMDVKSPQSVKESVDALVAATGGRLPTIVLNNAAGNFISPPEKLSPNAWKAINDIVFMGTVHVATEIGKRWIARRRAEAGGDEAELPHPSKQSPQVVFMTVGASYVTTGHPYLAPSAASKAAAFSFHQSMAAAWGKYNMRFFMVSPGPIYTEGAFKRLMPEGRDEDASATLPLRRTGTTAEYAEFVSFLCSEKCSWLTGTNIYYDGGGFATGGEFGALTKLTDADWRRMEQAVRQRNAQDKALRAQKAASSKL